MPPCGIRSAIALLVVASSPPNAGHAQGRFVVVPFESAPPPYIVIRVPLASGGCERMLFDTGTNTTILTPSVGARVGLTGGRDAELESLNGSARGIAGEARGIGFRDIPVGAVRTAIVTEIPGLPGFGGSLGGLYGHNWMSGAEYVIDYRAKHL